MNGEETKLSSQQYLSLIQRPKEALPRQQQSAESLLVSENDRII